MWHPSIHPLEIHLGQIIHSFTLRGNLELPIDLNINVFELWEKTNTDMGRTYKEPLVHTRFKPGTFLLLGNSNVDQHTVFCFDFLWHYELFAGTLRLWRYRDLRGNSFQCNCDNKWLMTWLKNTNATVSDVLCAGPSEMKGKRLNDLPIPPDGCISTGKMSDSPSKALVSSRGQKSTSCYEKRKGSNR